LISRRRKKLNLDPFHPLSPTPTEAAREAEQQQGATAEDAQEAPDTPGGAEVEAAAEEEGEGDEEQEDEEDDEEEEDDDDDVVLESDDDDGGGNTSEAERLRRQANREADTKLAQRLLGDLREEVASLETDAWEHEKPRFG